MDGGVISQTDKGQAGGMSVLAVHRGSKRPSTHWQTHFARAARVKNELATTIKVSRNPIIGLLSFLPQCLRKLAHLAAVQCLHDADAGKHRGPAVLDNQHKRLYRGLPFGRRGFLLWKSRYQVCSVAQRD
jgi:hypothetical protein